MAADRFSLYYVLTPEARIAVDSLDAGRQIEDWVSLWEVDVYQGSGWGREIRTLISRGRSQNYSDDEVGIFEERFPIPKPARELTPEMLRLLNGR
jgi:hypothetical protein